MQIIRRILAAALLAAVCSGCGGGASNSLLSTASNPITSGASGSGRATISVTWPDRSKLIPLAANSIRVVLQQGSSPSVQQLLPRPTNGSQSSLTFDPLPIGDYTATATAYPNANGSGTAQSTATIPLSIHVNQTTNFSITMASTIDHLEVTAPKSFVLIGGNLQASVAAKDASGSIVLLSPSKIQWQSSNTAFATVNSSGKITGISSGTPNISATDMESGKSANIPVLVKPVGTINFQTAVTYQVPTPGYLTIADLDGDGKFDVVAAAGTNELDILYGNGNGTLQPAVVLPGAIGSQIIAADLNGDGKLDLAVAGADLMVILNTGNRTFGPISHYAAGSNPAGLTANYFNGDSRLDIAVSNNTSDDMHVFINNGNGTFAAGVRYGAGSYPAKPESYDFNGDSKVDIALPNYVSGNVLIYFGDGAGRFTQSGNYKVGDYPAKIVKGDFNNDGIMDLATGNTFSHNVSLLFGHAGGTFTVTGPYPGNTYPHMLVPADLDGDGLLDLAMPNNGTNYFTVLRNIGAGVFAAPVSFPSGGNNTRTMDTADLNGDGKPDIVVGCENSNTISVLLNSTP